MTRKAWQEGFAAAGHIAAAVKKQRTGGSDSQCAFSFFFFFQPKTPARGLVLPTVNVAHSTPINLIQIMLPKHPQGLSS